MLRHGVTNGVYNESSPGGYGYGVFEVIQDDAVEGIYYIKFNHTTLIIDGTIVSVEYDTTGLYTDWVS